MTPSERVLESWRAHAREPYEFWWPRYIVPVTEVAALDIEALLRTMEHRLRVVE
jgi:hypothetical protein